MLLMVTTLLTSCRDYYDEMPLGQQEHSTEDMAMLRISLFTPGNPTTRSEAQIDAAVSERKIFNIRVYAFLNAEEIQASEYSGSTLEDFLDNQTALGYAIIDDVSQLTVTSDMEYQWAEMGLPKTVIGKKLDFYAMVNMKGDGFTNVEGLRYHPKRGDVEDCTFTAFGTADAKTKTAGVTATEQTTGLPASRILKGVAPVTSLEGQNTLQITLLRAVGKYEFYFAKPQNLNNTKVTKIVLKGNGVPTQEYVLPNASTDNNNLPHPKAVTLPSSEKETTGSITYEDATIPVKDFATTVNLENLGKGTFTQVLQNMTDNSITRYGLTYVRESDTKLTGEIYYSINGVAKAEPATFEIYTKDNPEDADTDDGNTSHSHTSACFPRNHYSVVYAYFQGGALQVKPIVNDWIAGTTHSIISATDAALSISKTYTQGWYDYVMWSSEAAVTYSTIDWNKNYCAVSYGYDADAGNRPKFATAFFVRTTSSNQLHIMCDNNAFGFITYTTGQQDYSAIQDEIIIPPGKRDYQTDFYLVPRHQLSLSESRYVNMMLVEDLGAGMSLQRLPFNHVLPGPASGETARLYYVTPDEYEQAINNRNTIQTLTSGGVIFTYGDGN